MNTEYFYEMVIILQIDAKILGLHYDQLFNREQVKSKIYANSALTIRQLEKESDIERNLLK